MKTVMGFGLMLLGCALICAGVYFGIWHWLVGSIITIVEQVQSDKIDAYITTWAVVKAIFFELPVALGGLFGGMSLMFGWALASDTV